MDKEEEKCDDLSSHSPCDELSQDDFSSSVSKSAMSEEQVGESVKVLHLNVGAG